MEFEFIILTKHGFYFEEIQATRKHNTFTLQRQDLKRLKVNLV